MSCFRSLQFYCSRLLIMSRKSQESWMRAFPKRLAGTLTIIHIAKWFFNKRVAGSLLDRMHLLSVAKSYFVVQDGSPKSSIYKYIYIVYIRVAIYWAANIHGIETNFIHRRQQGNMNKLGKWYSRPLSFQD